MDKDDVICFIWLLFCTPIPLFTVWLWLMLTGVTGNIGYFVIHFMAGLWTFVFIGTCFLCMYMIGTMDRVQLPADSTQYKLMDTIVFTIIFIVSVIIAYYAQIDM